jgi:hypothetical protein
VIRSLVLQRRCNEAAQRLIADFLAGTSQKIQRTDLKRLGALVDVTNELPVALKFITHACVVASESGGNIEADFDLNNSDAEEEENDLNDDDDDDDDADDDHEEFEATNWRIGTPNQDLRQHTGLLNVLQEAPPSSDTSLLYLVQLNHSPCKLFKSILSRYPILEDIPLRSAVVAMIMQSLGHNPTLNQPQTFALMNAAVQKLQPIEPLFAYQLLRFCFQFLNHDPTRHAELLIKYGHVVSSPEIVEQIIQDIERKFDKSSLKLMDLATFARDSVSAFEIAAKHANVALSWKSEQQTIISSHISRYQARLYGPGFVRHFEPAKAVELLISVAGKVPEIHKQLIAGERQRDFMCFFVSICAFQLELTKKMILLSIPTDVHAGRIDVHGVKTLITALQDSYPEITFELMESMPAVLDEAFLPTAVEASFVIENLSICSFRMCV